MKFILYALLHLHFHRTFSSTTTDETTTIASSTMQTTLETSRETGEDDIGTVPTTEQVMDSKIKVSDIPDVEESTDDTWDVLNWDKNKVIRDVAYYIRAHKFQDYDRRYYKSIEEVPSRFYEEFPKPPLRSLHWEVRRHCETSFVECLKYLERIIKQTALRREDDTVTAMKEQKWNLANNKEEILAVQRECQMAQRRDNLTMPPFQGPIERFQWRTTVSYYMCWYTMLGVPELVIFGESCDNHANCLIEDGPHNRDPRADDTKPYACALYSFCPDHCCPMRHIRYMKDCFQSTLNPCHAGNPPAHRRCTLNREENRDFVGLVANRINVTCECREPGYEWSSRFSLCVDINECTRGIHNCSAAEGETCFNLPGSFDCVCRFGYVYDSQEKNCVLSSEIQEALKEPKEERNITETKSILELIVQKITRSFGNRFGIDHFGLLSTILMHFLAY